MGNTRRSFLIKSVLATGSSMMVNPILVDWNKNVAARLNSFPGLGSLGLIESNGHQNYKNWSTMLSYPPREKGTWVHANNGVYELDSEFYRSSGGIFEPMPHYEEMFSKK